MCLYPYSKPEIANHDILCYKAVATALDTNKWRGPYYNKHSYKYNTIIKAESNNCTIPIDRLKTIKCSDTKDKIEDGFHSYLKREDCNYLLVQPIADKTKVCIIPAGSEFCGGFGNDVVSTHIVVFKEQKLYELYKKFRSLFRIWWFITGKLPKVKQT